MFQKNAGLVLIVLVALFATTVSAIDFPGNYPGQITKLAANQVKAQAGDRTCIFTSVGENIQIFCKNYASGQTFTGTHTFAVGDCTPVTQFLSTNLQWSFCRLPNPGVNQFEFSFDVIANLLEITGVLDD